MRSSLTILTMSLVLAQGSDAQQAAGLMPALLVSDSVATPDGVQLHYQMLGAGSDTVVFIHGGPGESVGAYLPDLDSLLTRHRVLAYDQRGGGYSTPVAEPARLGIDQHVADLEVLRKALGMRHLTLLAHSWGGAVAIRYALIHPGHVRRLVLVDILPPRADPFMPDAERALFDRVDSAALRRMPEAMAEWASGADPVAGCRLHFEILKPAYAADSLTASRIHGDWCAGPAAAVRNMPDVLAAGMASLGSWDWRDAVRSLHVPVLVIHGEQDFIPLASAREWVAILPNARLVTIPGSGHIPFAEQPSLFYAALEAFLSES
jgi:pimeloyl-ACP methyl ester carboxylesterase